MVLPPLNTGLTWNTNGLAAGVLSVYFNPLEAWGDDSLGQLNFPLEATNVIAVAAGDRSCAVVQDGSIVCWGSGLNASAGTFDAGAVAVPGW